MGNVEQAREEKIYCDCGRRVGDVEELLILGTAAYCDHCIDNYNYEVHEVFGLIITAK